MALTTSQIDVIYEEVLARQATLSEQQAFSLLSNTETTQQIETAIATLPEAAEFVDPIIRLYQGAFDRVPDTNMGFGSPASGFWVNVNAFRSGVSLVSMAEAFVASAEFSALYGTTAVTPALITAYYQHILGRAPAPSEVAAWQASGLDAAHILIGFTQSAEYISQSQPAINAEKVLLAQGQVLHGPLPPPPPQFTLTSDHDISGVNEGSTVIYTLQGPAADAGQLFSYNITGISAARIAGGQLTGTVTLDAQGLAHVAVTVLADNTTDGPTTMTLAVGSLTDSVAVNDTSLTPTTQFFTPTVGETLVGGPAATVFQGTVDTNIVGNNTLSNIVDVAKGNAAFHNTEYIIIDNSSGTNITPSSTGVQEMKITNIDASGGKSGMTNVDSQFMQDVTTVTSFGSSKGLNVFNLQNFISTINIEQSDAPGGLNFNVTMIDSTTPGGAQAINLDHAGTAGGGTFLSDETTSGIDVVGEFDISSFGQNKLTIDGTSIATTFKVIDTGSGADVTTIVSVDDTEALTLIDTTGVAGTVSMWGFEVETGNTLQVNEGGGTNTFGIHVEGNGTLNVNGGDGTDTLFAHFVSSDGVTDGGTINITEGNGNDTLDVDNSSGGNFQTVTATYGNGNDNLDVEVGNNSAVTLTAGNGNDLVGVHVAELGVVKVTLGNGANNALHGGGVTVDAGEQSQVTVMAGSGGNDVTINTVDSDTLPLPVAPAVEVDGHQTYTVTLGTGVNNLTITPGGSDPVSDDSPGDDFFVTGEPDSVVASNQVIKVNMGVGGAATQTVNIETGVNSTVGVTVGDGNNSITILADNDLWTHVAGTDDVTFAGAGGSQVNVQTSNGNNTILVDVDNTGTNPVTGLILDTGSNVQVTTGSGNDNIVIDLGTATTNTANVSAGAGNDRVQFDVANINSGIVADGGAGIDTIALVSASAGASAANLAGLSNFEILEVTDVLHNSVNLDNFAASTINHVVLDHGFSGPATISGAEQNFQLDDLAASTGTLNVLVDNAVINTNDAVGIKLDADSAGTTSFGTINLNPVLVNVVENVTIDSTTQDPLNLPTAQNNLHLSDIGLQTLTIAHDAGGDVTLDLDGSTINFGGSALTAVQAPTFTGGIIWDDGGIGNNSITFNAPVSGNDGLVFGNGNDAVTLGNGNNAVTLGNGNDTVVLGNGNNTGTLGNGTDSFTAGNGNNAVTIANGTSHLDTINLGSGVNTVTLNGAGGSGSSITFATHGANVDTINFNSVAQSGYSLPDTITGLQANDILHFNAAMFAGSPAFDFVTVSSQVGVLAAVAGDSNAHATFVYDTSTGNLYVDGDHNQLLSTAGTHDMQITLVGIPSISATNIHIS